jgi:hypothetical protein
MSVKQIKLKLQRNLSPKAFNRKNRVSMTMRRTPVKTKIERNEIKRKKLSAVRNKESLNQRRSTIQSMTMSTILRITIQKTMMTRKRKRRKK